METLLHKRHLIPEQLESAVGHALPLSATVDVRSRQTSRYSVYVCLVPRGDIRGSVLDTLRVEASLILETDYQCTTDALSVSLL